MVSMKRDMKKTLAIGITGSALIWLAFNPLPAGASMNQAEGVQRGGPNAIFPVVVPSYGTFGNASDGDLADCQYAVMANLTIAEFPQAQITTDEVVAAYNTYGVGRISPYWAGQWYVVNVGYDGFRASSVTTINFDQVESAANAGGVEVQISEQALGGPANLSHDFAIVKASSSDVFVVNSWYASVQDYSWANWNTMMAPYVIAYSAVTWN